MWKTSISQVASDTANRSRSNVVVEIKPYDVQDY